MRLNNGNKKSASKSSRSTNSSRTSRFEISDELFNNAPEDSSDDDGPWMAPSNVIGRGVNDLRSGRSVTPLSVVSRASTRSQRTAASERSDGTTTASGMMRRRRETRRKEAFTTAEPHPYGLEPQRSVTPLKSTQASSQSSRLGFNFEEEVVITSHGSTTQFHNNAANTTTFTGIHEHSISKSVHNASNNNGGSLFTHFGGGGHNGEEYPFSSDSEGEEHDSRGGGAGGSVGSIVESVGRSVKRAMSGFCTFIYMSLMWVIYIEKWCLASRQKSSNEEDSSSNEDRVNGHIYTNDYQNKKMSEHQYQHHEETEEEEDEEDEFFSQEETQTRSSIFGFFSSLFSRWTSSETETQSVILNNHQDSLEVEVEHQESFISRTWSGMERGLERGLESGLATMKNLRKYFWTFCKILACLLLVIFLTYLFWTNGALWYAKMAAFFAHLTRVEPKVTRVEPTVTRVEPKVEVKMDSIGAQMLKTHNQDLETIKLELNELISRLRRMESEVENQKNAPKEEVDTSKIVASMLPEIRNEIEEKVALSFESRKCPDPPTFQGLTVDETEEMIKSALTKVDANLAAIENKVTLDCGSKKCPDHSGFIGLSAEEIELMIKRAISKYDADKTGLPDLALESAGGSILSTRCTKSSDSRNSVISYWGFRLWSPPNSPRTIIQPGAVPGECWAFEGSVGDVVIKLAVPSLITGFTLEHIPKTVSRYHNIDSAPKSFQVLGLQSEHDTIEVHDYGTFSYEDNDEPIQFFDVANRTSKYYPIVELKILSNHGNMKHTCIYRFRVHGYIDLERSHGGGKPRNVDVDEDDSK